MTKARSGLLMCELQRMPRNVEVKPIAEFEVVVVVVAATVVPVVLDVAFVGVVEDEWRVGVGNDKDVLVPAKSQKICASDSAVANSWTHPAEIQLTKSFVK